MSTSNLFKPLALGKVKLQNRIALAPLTRFRADDAHVPLPFVADYYAQRGSSPGTLLITEATFIAPRAGGYPNAPGIWSADQIASWKRVTDAVHAKKSFIYLQLWALGRAAYEAVLKGELGEDAKVVSASNIPFEGGATPTPLTEEEIHEYIGLYAQAAKNAIEAGFDGVEIHGANGYLIDQFTQSNSNNRTDAWGGSIEKRSKFALEVTKAVIAAVGAERTGIRLSPFSEFQGMKMPDPVPQFTYLATELKKLKLAYLHLVEARVDGNVDNEDTTEKLNFLVNLWDNQSPVFIAGGYNAESARKAVDVEYKDHNVGIVFGRYFISNPDLVFRVREGIPFTPYDRNKFYNAKQEDGYINWPFSKEFEESEKATKL
jgi:NADPH2 dehydrogenase